MTVAGLDAISAVGAKEVSPVRERREMRDIMKASPVRGDTDFVY